MFSSPASTGTERAEGGKENKRGSERGGRTKGQVRRCGGERGPAGHFPHAHEPTGSPGTALSLLGADLNSQAHSAGGTSAIHVC